MPDRTETDIIPGDVKDFILRYIDSIAQLEGLLLLRADPSVRWPAALLGERLYIGENEAEELLGKLHQAGFLERQDEPRLYWYAPKMDDGILAHAADAYARYLVPITNLVHEKSKTKIQKFSDAFWLRKE
jgi:hypothetical protein